MARVDLEQQLGATPECFGQGPFAFRGETLQIAIELVRQLDLRLRHAMDCVVTSI